MTLALVDEAVASGARISQACAYLQLTPRTLQRWREQGPDGGHRAWPLLRPLRLLDIWSRKIVGWGVHDEQCGDFAAQLLEATCEQLGAATANRVLHSDNGKPMNGSSMLSAMQWLGIVPSFSRPYVSDDNSYAEAVFRTLKYKPGCTGIRFDSPDEAVAWVDHLVRWYNRQHLHSAIGFVTPHDRHTGADIPLLEARGDLYKRAHRAQPERWTRHVRAWSRPVTVRLHPDRPTIVLKPRVEGRAA